MDHNIPNIDVFKEVLPILEKEYQFWIGQRASPFLDEVFIYLC